MTEQERIYKYFVKSQKTYYNPNFPDTAQGVEAWKYARNNEYETLMQQNNGNTANYKLIDYLEDYSNYVDKNGSVDLSKIIKHIEKSKTGGVLSSDTLSNIGDKLGDIFGGILSGKSGDTTTGTGVLPPTTPPKKGLSPLAIGGIVLGVLVIGGIFIYVITKKK